MGNLGPEVILMIVVFAVAISSHESAHAYVAFRCGDSTAKRQGRISMNPVDHADPFGTVLLPAILLITGAPFLFGWAKPVPVNPSALGNPRRDEALVSAAGPVANFLLALTSVLLYVILFPFLNSSAFQMGEAVGTLLQFNTLINTVLAVFNLIPVEPLDGGGILQYYLSRRQARWMKQNRMLLFGLLIVLIFLGVFRVVLVFFASFMSGLQNFLIHLLWL